MKYRIQSWLLILIPLFVLCVQPEAHSASQQSASAHGKLDASTLFEQNCAKCHGKDGRAKTVRGKMVGARNLTNPNWQAKVTDEQIAAAIRTGPKAMPSFAKKFSQAEIDSLVAYVRTLKGQEKEPKKN